MGSIWMSGTQFWGGLGDTLAFKAGVLLDQEELAELLRASSSFASYAKISPEDDSVIRLHSTEYEGVFEYLLFRLGRLERERNAFPGVVLHHRYKDDPKRHAEAMSVIELFTEFVMRAADQAEPGASIDPRPYLKTVKERVGLHALGMAIEVIEMMNVQIVKCPWSPAREADWQDELRLRELFGSEGLLTPTGPFIDQRFIDFLHRNFDRIDDVHWRKFEALTAEFFHRAGFVVELGPGRDDGGVDLRVWPEEEGVGKPPAILIQCKRQKAPVPRVVMKALYADVLHEGAQTGLIVTTSRVSPGAKADRVARGYPIGEIERAELKELLRTLRKPGPGLLL